jgi:aminoglycoside phosphotransferase family enzyme/predicted kinase
MAGYMSNTTPETHPEPLIAGLLRPEAYGHPADPIRLSETHISWVIRAGDFAYKLKKPVNFGFLDFSTPERRLHFCNEELRLNRRYAPDLYLDVEPVAGPPERPRMGGTGPVLDHAVRMRAFDDTQLFDRLARTDRLLPEHLDRVAAILAEFHGSAAKAGPDDSRGLPEKQRQAAELNFDRMGPLLETAEDRAKLAQVDGWTRAEFACREGLMAERKAGGFVRECHGDLHLGNIVLIEERPTLFDGIEFNEDLRWIDVLSEAAFLAMDLEAHGAPRLASRFLNGYLEWTGDYGGLPLLDWFKVYRALVRAKVTLITRSQIDAAGQRAELLARARRYLDYALDCTRPRPATLVITHGLSGSGKSRLSECLAERLPAFRLRSDLERKRLAGLPETGTALPAAELYGPASTAATYRYLADTTETLLRAGHSVIVDATFLKKQYRYEHRQRAERCRAGFSILDCRAPAEVLRARVRARAALGGDPSDADEAVLLRQIEGEEPLTADEEALVLSVDTAAERVEAAPDLADLARTVRDCLRGGT